MELADILFEGLVEDLARRMLGLPDELIDDEEPQD
jgi:hypothetical protein